ncbi:hypothetical protein GCM10022224_010400 [Nonomuraea antimicrobica]|uniref:Uncharacterized protein n=1 Tax=Nonomuraea antimicrobica TaxID=561173 RepID=A0ABP7B759_9ACTN
MDVACRIVLLPAPAPVPAAGAATQVIRFLTSRGLIPAVGNEIVGKPPAHGSGGGARAGPTTTYLTSAGRAAVNAMGDRRR